MKRVKVVWSYFAIDQMDLIFEYYKTKASLKTAKKLISNLIVSTETLVDNPNLGQVEELLAERKEVYRYLIFQNYKIVYSVNLNEKLIKVADVFDTRQNPLKIKRNK